MSINALICRIAFLLFGMSISYIALAQTQGDCEIFKIDGSFEVELTNEKQPAIIYVKQCFNNWVFIKSDRLCTRVTEKLCWINTNQIIRVSDLSP